MTDKIAETVARYKATGYDAGIEPARDGKLVLFTDYEALARDLAAARDRAEKQAQAIEGWREDLTAIEMQRRELQAARDRLAAELAEARTVQAAAGVLLDWWENVDQDDPSIEQAIGVVQIMGYTQEEVDRWHNALRALAKGDTP